MLCVLAGCQVAAAQTPTPTPATGKESAPEIDVFVNINQKFRFYFFASESKGLEDGSTGGKVSYEAIFGAHLDYRPSKYVLFRTGYRFRTPTGSGTGPKEHRIVAEQTFQKKLLHNILLSDRNGEDFRIIDGDFSFRYRNRPRVEREFKGPKGRTFNPYAAVEIFYDSRYNDAKKKNYTFGTELGVTRGKRDKLFLFKHQIVLDVSFTRVNDPHSSVPHTNVFGSTLTFYF